MEYLIRPSIGNNEIRILRSSSSLSDISQISGEVEFSFIKNDGYRTSIIRYLVIPLFLAEFRDFLGNMSDQCSEWNLNFSRLCFGKFLDGKITLSSLPDPDFEKGIFSEFYEKKRQELIKKVISDQKIFGLL